jgi:hypothetical protein
VGERPNTTPRPNFVFFWVVRQQQQLVRLRQRRHRGARIVIACVVGAEDFEEQRCRGLA